MKVLLQTGPDSFQTEDLQMIYCISGTFNLDDYDNKLKIESNICYIDNIIIKISKFFGEIGGSYWLSSIAMVLYMQNHKHIFENKQVLEMGAGVGLAGMYVKRCCNPANVTFSDSNPDICQENLEKNGIEARSIKLDWDDDNNINNEDRYDVVIAADCIYRNTKNSFVRAVRKLIKPNGILLMFNPVRGGLDECIYALSGIGGNVNYVDSKLYYNDEYETTIICTVTIFNESL